MISRLNAVDFKLTQKGASFLTKDQVAQQFPDQFAAEILTSENSIVIPRIEVPEPDESEVTEWISCRTTYSTGGTTYEIQKLYAQPKSQNSPLTNMGSRIVGDNNIYEAAVYDVLDTVAVAIVDGLLEELPGASITLTLFDVAQSFVGGLTETTEVEGLNISYTWSSITTAAFAYVKRVGQSDDEQRLALISTKAQTVAGYQIPRFYYTTVQGSNILSPGIIQGDRTITSIAPGYDNDALAVTAYKTATGGLLHRYVDRVNISAGISTTVVNIYPLCPRYPFHCDY